MVLGKLQKAPSVAFHRVIFVRLLIRQSLRTQMLVSARSCSARVLCRGRVRVTFYGDGDNGE